MEARAEQTRFLTLSAARKELTSDQERRLLGSMLDALADDTPLGAAQAEYDRRRQEALALQAALTDFRLFWDTLGRALTGRALVLVDAEHVPGRRHLMLFDPEQFRVPLPVMVAPPARKKVEGEED
jgi:hypothetical protein